MGRMLVIAVLLNATAFGQSGQSLGDIARANREKQQEQQASSTKPKTITNADLPESSTGIPDADASDPMTMVSGVNRPYDGRSNQRLNQQVLAEEHAGNQWRERIQMQESRVADLQARIDQAKAAMHSNSSVQSEGPFNRAQGRQMQRVAQMEEMLDQQKRKLEMMQEAARRAGMHTSVYDP
ncbi:MAG: hypothetical protein WA477_18225 [Candidatus Sulfotelmatobacter sp.]